MVGRESWNKGFVQRVMDAHNASYGTHLGFIGFAEDTYPELRGKNIWDWVCREQTSGVETAVEVKRVTRQLAERTYSELTTVGQAICAEVRDKLRGVFSLWVNFPTPARLQSGTFHAAQEVDRVSCWVCRRERQGRA